MTFTAELGVLPWNGTEVRVIKNLTTLFEKNGLGNSARYLPKQTTLFADKDIDGELIDNFINKMSEFLEKEINQRIKRIRHFIQLGLFDVSEIEAILAGYTMTQPWALHYGIKGGLGVDRSKVRIRDVPRGVIPCSTMRNHGVAWEPASDDRIKVWLATGQKRR